MIRIFSIVSFILSLGVSLLAILPPLLWTNGSWLDSPNATMAIIGFLSWPVVGGIACIAGAVLTAVMVSLTFGAAIKERWFDTAAGVFGSLAALCSALLGGLSCLTGGSVVFFGLLFGLAEMLARA